MHSIFQICWFVFCFFKQKTAYDMRISDWSSDVCSSDLFRTPAPQAQTENESSDDRLAFDERRTPCFRRIASARKQESQAHAPGFPLTGLLAGYCLRAMPALASPIALSAVLTAFMNIWNIWVMAVSLVESDGVGLSPMLSAKRSEEPTSELQSIMRISSAVFCLKKKQQSYNLHSQH